MSDTSFRTWMDDLKNDRGARPEWPLLLNWMLDAEFQRERQVDRPYAGPRVLIDRTHHDCDVTVAEKRATYGLCHHCWQESGGCLWIGDMPIWLLSYEVPNQFNEKKRCADLVGLTADGALVVFEAKLGANSSHPPLSAVLEGLDYLACLTTAGAFERLTSELKELKRSLPVPPGFEGVEPKSGAIPMLIVLADTVYYTYNDNSGRSPGWREFLKYGQKTKSVMIRFARSEPDADGCFSRTVNWLS